MSNRINEEAYELDPLPDPSLYNIGDRLVIKDRDLAMTIRAERVAQGWLIQEVMLPNPMVTFEVLRQRREGSA